MSLAGTNIALAQIAASAFGGLDIEQVSITTGDTDTAPLAGLSAGTKTIYTVGTAVMQARWPHGEGIPTGVKPCPASVVWPAGERM